MKYSVLLGVVAIIFVSVGCNQEGNQSATPPTFTREQVLPTDAEYGRSGIGVVLKDMDGDGDLDILVSTPAGVKYFENTGDGKFTDRGKIAESGAEYGRSGIGLAVDNLDGDGILDIVIASPGGVRIIKNPIAQKK